MVSSAFKYYFWKIYSFGYQICVDSTYGFSWTWRKNYSCPITFTDNHFCNIMLFDWTIVWLVCWFICVAIFCNKKSSSTKKISFISIAIMLIQTIVYIFCIFLSVCWILIIVCFCFTKSLTSETEILLISVFVLLSTSCLLYSAVKLILHVVNSLFVKNLLILGIWESWLGSAER